MKRTACNGSHQPILEAYGLQSLPIEKLKLLHFLPGEYLYRMGKAPEYLMLMVSGRAKVCVASENGKTLLLTFYSGAGLLGDIELVLGLPAATSDVQAISELTAIGIPYACAGDLLQNPVFVLKLAKELAKHVDCNSQNSVATVLNPLQARLCSYIRIVAANGFFQEKLTELAELLGTSYRHLLRTLDALCAQGVLSREENGFRVIDEESLQRLGGDAYRF
ncbi:MAG: cyclic nucleotide-binding domain-containing protein [Clostridia bacterium]